MSDMATILKNAKFDEVDQALNGIPSLIAQGNQTPSAPPATPAAPAATADPTAPGRTALGRVWDSVRNWDKQAGRTAMAGVSKAGDFMTGGLLPGLVRRIDPSGQRDIENMQREHPIAAGIGSGVGAAASLRMPGATILKGVTTAGKIGAAAVNAAINMAPFAAGAGLNTYNQTGDIGAAAKKALAAEALGVGAGTALGGAGLLFGKIAKESHPILNQIDSASYGLTSSDVSKPGAEFAQKMGLNKIGYKAATGDTQLDKIMTLLRTEGGRGKAGIEKAAQWVRDQYAAVNQTFKAAGATVASKVPDILNSPIVQTMKAKFDPQDVETTIQTLVNEADKRIAAGPNGWTDARTFLNAQMQRGIKIGQSAEGADLSAVTQRANMGELLQDSASVVKAHMNELTGTVLKQTGGPDLEAVDQIYSAYPSLQRDLARRSGKPMASMTGGSETTAGLGTLTKRGVGAVTNQVMGRTAAGLDKVLQGLAKTNSADLPGATARLTGQVTKPAFEPAALVAGTGTDPAETAASVAQSESGLPAEHQQAAKDQTNTAWADQIQTRLGALYDTMIAPMYGSLMSKDQFFKTAQQMTNNWDPHLTAGFVFQDKSQALAYLKSYDTALKLQGMNLDQALSASGGINPLQHPGAASILNPLVGAATGRAEQTQQSAMGLENLKNIIVQHATDYGAAPSAALVKQVSQMIDGIAAMRVSAAKKKQILRDELQQYGVDYGQLEKYGFGKSTGKNQGGIA